MRDLLFIDRSVLGLFEKTGLIAYLAPAGSMFLPIERVETALNLSSPYHVSSRT